MSVHETLRAPRAPGAPRARAQTRARARTRTRRGAAFRGAAAALGLALLAAACGRSPESAPEVDFAVVVTPRPPSVGPTAVEVRLTGADGAPIEGARVHVEGNMDHAGMVPEMADAAEVEPGLYRADIDLTMGGDWFLLLRAEFEDGRSQEQVHRLPGVETERGG